MSNELKFTLDLPIVVVYVRALGYITFSLDPIYVKQINQLSPSTHSKIYLNQESNPTIQDFFESQTKTSGKHLTPFGNCSATISILRK